MPCCLAEVTDVPVEFTASLISIYLCSVKVHSNQGSMWEWEWDVIYWSLDFKAMLTQTVDPAAERQYCCGIFVNSNMQCPPAFCTVVLYMAEESGG